MYGENSPILVTLTEEFSENGRARSSPFKFYANKGSKMLRFFVSISSIFLSFLAKNFSSKNQCYDLIRQTKVPNPEISIFLRQY
jgi:hypothetical protein